MAASVGIDVPLPTLLLRLAKGRAGNWQAKRVAMGRVLGCTLGLDKRLGQLLLAEYVVEVGLSSWQRG